MNPRTPRISGQEKNEDSQVRKIYKELLEGWNNRDAHGMAEVFTKDGNIIGFDGSQINGRLEIEKEMGQIFSNHPTGTFVGIIREVRFLSSETAILRAVAGMVPRGGSAINHAVNAIQTLVLTEQQGQWYIALFQNTPAAFHGRPELAEQLTIELGQALRESSSGKEIK